MNDDFADLTPADPSPRRKPGRKPADPGERKRIDLIAELALSEVPQKDPEPPAEAPKPKPAKGSGSRMCRSRSSG